MVSDSMDLQTLVDHLGSLVRRIEDLETRLADLNVQHQDHLSTGVDEFTYHRLIKTTSRLDACRRRLQGVIQQLRRGLIAYWRSSSQGQQQMHPLLAQLAAASEQVLQQFEA
jgi:uncharacterized coiled-coil protein SlyX